MGTGALQGEELGAGEMRIGQVFQKFQMTPGGGFLVPHRNTIGKGLAHAAETRQPALHRKCASKEKTARHGDG